jgi:YegS/Rv2252/BmrU family lipid kinase
MALGLVRIIVNPISGRGTHRGMLRDLEHHLATRGYPVQVAKTRHAGHARELAASAPDDATCVVSVGGDGTHREVLSGLIGRRVPACILPSGTENVLCRTFRLSGLLSETVSTICRGRAIPLDVGFANGRPFMMFCGIGFDAAVTAEVHEKRRGRIWRHSYYVPILRAWWNYKFPPIQVTVDGRTVVDDAGIVLVANTPLYADGMSMASRALGDDGLLDVVAYRTRSRWEMLLQFARTKMRTQLDDPRVIYAQGRQIEVRSNGTPVPTQTDGDPLMATPVSFTIQPKAVRLLVPDPARNQ